MAAAPDPTASASPIGKMSRLRKGRKGKENNISSPSLGSSSGEGDESRAASRTSLESSLDRLKPDSRRSSEDKRSITDTSRFSKLIPSKIKNRRKSGISADDDGRRLTLLATTDAVPRNGRISRNESNTSLANSSSVHSSLMTEDSEQEGPASRPTLSSHESHSGYLTISSPQINAQTNVPIITETLAGDHEPVAESAHPSTADSSILPTRPELERRNSPVDKIKSAFSSVKKKASFETDASQSHRPDRAESALSDGKSEIAPIVKEGPPDSVISDDKKRDKPSKTSLRGKQRLPSLDTSERPKTPPNQSLDAPSTLVTPPTPTHSSPTKDVSSPTPTKSTQSSPAVSGSPLRIKPKGFSLGSLTGTKPSSTLAQPPLTPPIEETKTPGGSLTSPGSTGFFSSVFSAAQSAANQFSNPFVPGPQGQKGKQTPTAKNSAAPASVVITDHSDPSTTDDHLSERTTGIGILKTSGLGASDSEPSPMTTAFDAANQRSPRPQNSDSASYKGEDAAAVAQSVAAAYQNPATSALREETLNRPKSIASQRSFNAEQSPSRSPAVHSDAGDIKRTGSIRSRLSDRRKGRKRGSSAGTAHTLGPSASGANSLAPTPSIASGFGGGHRLTSFAVASSKRNKDFHQLFRSVPEDDYLIEDYSAALQRDILLHGRFYVSEGHIGFSSNILGWVTNLVIAFDEIVSIEKKNTAIVFPNALVIQTQHARNVFASFVARDSTFDLLLGIWRTSHPNLRVTPNSISLDNTAEPDKPEKAESTGSEDGSDDGSDDVYDEDAEEDDDLVSMTEVGANGSVAGSEAGDITAAIRKPSAMPAQASSPPMNGVVPKGLEGSDAVVTGAAVSADYPGHPSHDPTECTDGATHYERPLIDTTIPAPLGKIYSLWFGPASGTFMRKWLVEDQKSRELVYEDDKIGLDEAHKTFTYSYIKPLNAPVGPRQTKCLVTANLQAFDLDRSVTVDCSTQTPDVPSGNIFVTRTRYCLMWGPGNSTRVVATCTIEWSGKSWLKGPIEKGANDGQTQYIKDLIASLKAAITTKPPVKGLVRGKKGKRARRETFDTAGTDAEREKANAKAQEVNWGLLEHLRPVFGPFADLLGPVLTPQVVIAVLLLLLAQSWFFSGTGGRRSSVGLVGSGPERMAAYEALWAREEAELWDWLEERTGLDQGLLATEQAPKQKILAKNMAKGVKDQRMESREMDEAIRIMNEKMDALKEAVSRRKTA